MSKKNREARKEPTFTKTVTLPGKVEHMTIDVSVTQDEPPPAPVPMTPRDTALAVAAIVDAAMATFGHRYPFRLVERLRGLDVYFGVPGAPERFVESLRQDLARQMPGVTVNGKRRG